MYKYVFMTEMEVNGDLQKEMACNCNVFFSTVTWDMKLLMMQHG